MKPRRSASAARPRASRRRTASLLIVGLLTGCAYGTLPPRIVQGKDFSVEKAKAVEEGDSLVEVRATLGDPLEISERNGAEVWRYYARERKDGVTYILGFIPKKTPHFIWDYELELVARDGRVEDVEYTETKIR
jgi:outer membrane protein assembly factor BamE (lipoprotein component of BamABCDE complex)